MSAKVHIIFVIAKYLLNHSFSVVPRALRCSLVIYATEEKWDNSLDNSTCSRILFVPLSAQ